MTDYIEAFNFLFDKFSFFIYGIFCGYVVHFFEWEPMNKRNFNKIIIFWFLSVFANLMTRSFYKTTNNDEKIVVSMIIACVIYFIGLYIFKKDNKEAVTLSIINYFTKKVGVEVRKTEKIEENKEKKDPSIYQ